MTFIKVIQILFLTIALILPATASIKNPPHPHGRVVAQNEAYWLAINIYHEAGNQSKAGKMAVGIITLNRVNHARYPNTVERVVKERKQFSWYNKRVVPKPKHEKAWQESMYVAHLLLTNRAKTDIMYKLKDATHYHATYVKPSWSKSLVKVAQIGDHVFYRMKN